MRAKREEEGQKSKESIRDLYFLLSYKLGNISEEEESSPEETEKELKE